MDHPADLAFALGGLVDSATLHENFTRREVRRALVEGSLVHVARDRYGLKTVSEALELARRVNGHLVHESAALHWGWEVWRAPETPRVAVPRRRGNVEGAIRLDLQHEDLDGWATNKLQTALMCAADLDFPDALAVVDSALRHGLSEQRVRRAAAGIAGERGRRARRVIDHADRRAANPFESALRACAIDAGLDVVVQFRVEAAGLVLHPDLANPLLAIALEAESWEFHGRQRADFDRDCRRYNALVAAGWTVLRFTWPEVMYRPAEVVATIRATAALAGSRAS